MRQTPEPDPGARIDEEFRHHLEELERMLVARGLDPGSAAAEARWRFGRETRYRARCLEIVERPTVAGGRWMMLDWIRQDLAFAVRTLLRAPGFTLVVVLTLALGLGANTAIFSVIHGVLVRPLGVVDPDRLVVVLETHAETGQDATPTSVGTLDDWRAQAGTLAGLAAWQWGSITLEDPERPVELLGVLATGNFFPILGARPVLGRTFGEHDQVEGSRGAVAVISQRLWLDRFGGDPSVIGRSIRMDGASYEIVGVMPPSHVAPDPSADVWIPVDFTTSNPTNRGFRVLHTVGRLAPGATLAAASAELAGISERIAATYPASARGWSARVVPFRDRIVGDVQRSLLIAFASVGLLLLIACVNIANLLMARAAGRGPELALRAALGAGRQRIAGQLLTESLVLSLLGGAFGVLMAFLAHPLLLRIDPGVLPRSGEIRLDVTVLGFALALSAATGILFGLLPAARAGRVDVATTLRSGRTGGTPLPRGQWPRRLLVMGQLALTLMLLVGAGLLGRTFLELRRVDPGFEPDGVMAARVFLDTRRYSGDEDQRVYLRDVLDRVRGMPGVEAAGITSSLPMDPVAVNFDLPFRTEATAGVPDGDLPQADFRLVSPGYFETLGFRLLEGRLFGPGDREDARYVAVVNRTMAERHWPGDGPVGRRLETVYQGWRWYDVVGVVEDTRYYGLDAEPRPEMYVVLDQVPFTAITVTARYSGTVAGGLAALEAAVVEADPLQPPQALLPVERLVADSIAAERFYATLLGLFALVATLLATAGVYGVISYGVGQRFREIGVRIALGASRRRVVRSVVAGAAAVALPGILIGVAGALFATRLLRGMLFGVGTTDPVTYGAVALLLAVVALGASSVPALRAGSVDPMRVLREE